MISVIVPVYKAESFIRRCIDSIISQTYTDWELLLIDDGSPDESGAICDSYAGIDSRIKVFHKKNGGVSSARNLGIENAQGDWMAFVDADDYILPEFLNHLANRIQSGIDLIISGSKRFGDLSSDCSIPYDCEYNSQSLIINKLNNNQSDSAFHVTCSYPWGKLLRTNVIKQNNLCFDTTLKVSEDTCFMFRYLDKIETILFIKGGNYMYYTSKGAKAYMQMSFAEYKRHTEGLKCTLEGLSVNKQINCVESYYTRTLLQLYFCAFLNGLSILDYSHFYEQWKLFKAFNTYGINMLLSGMTKKRRVLYLITTKVPLLLYLLLWVEKSF